MVRIYEDKDFDQIQAWNLDRQHPGFSRETIPPFGQIVDDTAAGFLIETDCGFSILDYYITNPKARLTDRIYATKAMLEGAINRSTDRGFKYLIGYSKSRGGVKFSKRYGFNIEPEEYFVFRKNLEEVSQPPGVRLYQNFDWSTIEPWLCDTGKEWLARTELPPTGFIFEDVACLFLIKTDSKLGILDCFATNKAYSVKTRVQSAKAVLSAAQNYAIDCGYVHMTGNTRSAQALSLFVRNGFKYDDAPYHFIRKRLGLSVSKRLPDPNFGRVEQKSASKKEPEFQEWRGWASL